MKLSLSRETLAELTADEMSAVVGGADTDSCSCTILSCVTNDFGSQTTEAFRAFARVDCNVD